MIRYIRNADKSPRGVTVAVLDPVANTLRYGYSLWNPVDKWSKKKGIKIAVARAVAEEYQLPGVDDRKEAVVESLKALESRATKYFKDLSPESVKLPNFVA
jgi:hypothetical protein